MNETNVAVAVYWKLEPKTDQQPIEIPNAGRNDLAVFLGANGFNRGAEIGVAEGEYSEILCRANPNLRLMCVDPWAVQADYRDGKDNPADAEANYKDAVKRLAPYTVNMIRATSAQALPYVPDGSLDFVYIDANHEFAAVAHDLHHWGKKVRSGGIIAGHDYFRAKARSKWGHVKDVVDAWTNAYRIAPWFVLGRKWADAGEIRDHNRSFFWVKP